MKTVAHPASGPAHPGTLVFKRIMVATDFSPSSEAAVRAAASLATAYGAELLVLHVASFVSYDVAFANVPRAEGEERHASQRRLADIARDMETHGLRVRTFVRTGRPARMIADCAREQAADLVVVGTHGWHGLNRFLSGSVAQHVVRLAPCHVLTVKAAP